MIRTASRRTAWGPWLRLHAELAAAASQPPDWDGAGAMPPGPATVRAAHRLLRTLAGRVPPPELTPDPNGTLTVEWTAGRRTVTWIVGRRTWGLFAQDAGRTAWRARGRWPLDRATGAALAAALARWLAIGTCSASPDDSVVAIPKRRGSLRPS